MVDWSYFDTYKDVIDVFMPDSGEGNSKASQIVTAVNKLIYKWYNDGDVYDNSYSLDGWWNDISSYANWLYKNTDVGNVLDRIKDARNEDDYENILKDLADDLLDKEKISKLAVEPKTGSIYDCDGPFRFVEPNEDEDEDW